MKMQQNVVFQEKIFVQKFPGREYSLPKCYPNGGGEGIPLPTPHFSRRVVRLDVLA